jgi:murein DD-endopeptidase MepM/ murein hydrolase activator NlpD
LRDEGEPPIGGVPIRVAGLTTATGQDGSYSLAGVAAGSQEVYVESPTQEPATAFRYISSSVEDFQSIQEPLLIAVSADTELSIALTQGFLTLCYPGGTPYVVGKSYMEGRYYDRDPNPERYLWWNGESGIETLTGNRANHPSTDFGAAYDTPVVAGSPGTVSNVYTNALGELGVEIRHRYGWGTNYLHLSRQSVRVGQQVSRGQEIGRSGPAGDVFQHTHVDVFLFTDGGLLFFDPYRPLDAGDAGNWFIPYGSSDREWVPSFRDDTRNSVGYWTKDNDPQCLP